MRALDILNGFFAGTALLLSSSVLAAPVIRVDLHAPTGPLDTIDSDSSVQKIFERDAAIPYPALQALIAAEVAKEADAQGDVVKDFKADYIDYHMQVDSSAAFAFTETNQPTLTVLSQTQNKIRVRLTTKAKVDFSAVASATTDDHLPVPPFTEFPDFDGSIAIGALFTVNATADLALWPTVAAENVEVELENDVPEVTIEGLQGDMQEFAVVVGTTLGFTPVGALLGGPPAMGIAALLGSNAAYDAAVTAIRDEIVKGLEEAVKEANEELKDRLEAVLVPAVASANAVKDKALATSIPGLGGSVNQLQSQAGVSLDVRTDGYMNGGTRTVVTVRFDGQPRSGRVSGTMRLPKAKCHMVSKKLAGMTVNTGVLEPHNEDLSQGMSCSAALGSTIGKDVFLGGTPPGTSLPKWKSAGGQLVGKGSVKDVTTGANSGYYECDFEVTGLPKGALAFESTGALSNRLGDYAFAGERRWVMLSGIGQPWELGGEGACSGTGVSGGLTPNKLERAKGRFDPVLNPAEERGGIQMQRNPAATIQQRGAGQIQKNPAASPIQRSPATSPALEKEAEGVMQRGKSKMKAPGGLQETVPQLR